LERPNRLRVVYPNARVSIGYTVGLNIAQSPKLKAIAVSGETVLFVEINGRHRGGQSDWQSEQRASIRAGRTRHLTNTPRAIAADR
jgi:hypothetical protein